MTREPYGDDGKDRRALDVEERLLVLARLGVHLYGL